MTGLKPAEQVNVGAQYRRWVSITGGGLFAYVFGFRSLLRSVQILLFFFFFVS